MKIVMQKIPAESKLKAGSAYEFTGAELDVLAESGHEFITAAEHAAQQQLLASREAAVDNAIKTSKAFAPKEDTATVKATAMDLEASKPGLGISYINNLPAKVQASNLGQRTTSSVEGISARLEVGEVGLRETVRGFLQATEPEFKLRKLGGMIRAVNNDEKGIKDATTMAHAKSEMLSDIITAVEKGGNFALTEDFVKAAYDGYADPAGALGVLNTALTLQWSFGHLENQLLAIGDITTDTTGTPVLFKQWARSRYQQVPGVMLKTLTNSWGTNASPGTDVDVMVQMSNYAGVGIGINNFVLGTTARALLAEQKNPMLYGLAEYIFYTLINTAINGSTRFANDGVATSTITAASAFVDPTFGKGYFNVAGATLSTFVSVLRAAMNLSKFPGGDEAPGATDLQRFVWAHTNLEATIAASDAFQLNQSIQGIAQNKGENLIQTGMFTRIGNNKFRASQLIADNNSTSGSGADSGTNALTVVPGNPAAANVVGIGGTRNGLMFVSRPPLDYTKVDPSIPTLAAIEMFTTPKLKIPFMIVKFLDNFYETVYMRAACQWGTGLGDERQLMLLRQK
jgi:hypothetical protein